MLKRILAMILCVVMTVSMLPVQTFATEHAEEPSAEVTEPAATEIQETEAIEETELQVTMPVVTEPAVTETQETEAEITEPEEIETVETLPAEIITDEEALATSRAVVKSGSCGDYAKWSLDSYGELRIYGTGAMQSYGSSSNNAPWYSYRDTVKSVVIESGITRIGSYAFYSCGQITSVSIASTVTAINTHAFGFCTSLQKVTIPNGVTTIGNYAFYGCTALTGATIPSSVTSIGGNAFYNCSSLKSLYIPSSVTSIGSSAFYGCTSLSITYPGTMRDWAKINTSIFQANCSNGTVCRYGSCGEFAKYTIDSYGELCVYGTGAMQSYGSSNNNAPWYSYRDTVKSVVIESGITRIGSYAFYSCGQITSVSIASTVTAINTYAFGFCTSLRKATIPNGVTSIGSGAFYGCTSLTGATIPSSVTSISGNAFYNCSSLKSLYIPSSVTSIGSSAFYGCTSLSITYPGTMRDWAKINTSIFQASCSNGTVCRYGSCGEFAKYTIDSYGELCVYGTGAMQSYGSSSNNAPWYSYRDTVKSVVIERGITSIGSYTFYSCGQITSVSIANTVTAINTYAFGFCDSLQKVTIPSSVTSIGSGAFYGCTALTEATIPSSVTSISGNAFYNCSSLKSLYIPSSVTSIGSSAFYGCTSLSITYPGTMRDWAKINTSIFQASCSNGTVCRYGSCGEFAKYTIDSYGELRIYGTGAMQSYGSSSNNAPWYSHRDTVKSVVIESGITRIGSYAFYSCGQITHATIGESVTNINAYAFFGCSGLKRFTFLGDAPTIVSTAFYNVKATAVYPASAAWSSSDLQNYGGTISWTTKCTNHLKVTIPAVEPTCTGYGKTAGSKCGYCGATLTYQQSIAPLGHVEVIQKGKEATCTETGLTEGKICSRCSKVLTSQTTISALGHEEIVDKGITPTCTEPGISDYITCGRCQSVLAQRENLPALGHAEVIDEAVPVTCTTDGKTEGKHCSRCTETLVAQNIIFAKGHTEVIDEAVPVTCTTNGKTEGKHCSVCNEVLVAQETISANGHKMEDGICTVCGEAAITASGSCGSAVKWSLNAKGVLTISGTGAMSSYTSSSLVPWAKDADQITQVVIEEGITAVGQYAFSGCSIMTGVVFPESLQTIGMGAFRTCKGLTQINIPASVTKIDSYVFENCSNLTAVKITNLEAWCGITFGHSSANPLEYAHNLYLNDELITDLVIPNGITTIGGNAFEGGTCFRTVTIPYGVKTINMCAFYGCSNVAELNLPTSVTFIDDFAFANWDGLTTLILPNGLKTIGEQAFAGCDNLTMAYIPKSVTNIRNCNNMIEGAVGHTGFSGIFARCSKDMVIYCGASSEPSGWIYKWNYIDLNTPLTTIWGIESMPAKMPEKIEIETLPTNTWYVVDQPIDLTSLTLLVTDADGRFETVDAENVAVWSGDTSKSGVIPVAVFYFGQTAQFEIVVHNGSNGEQLQPSSDYPESLHNYNNNTNQTWTYSCEGAEYLRLTFSSQTRVENTYDKIYIYDGNDVQCGSYTGTSLAGKTITVQGDTVKIRLQTDGSVNDYGFSLDSIYAKLPAEYEHEPVNAGEYTAPTCYVDGYWTYKCFCGEPVLVVDPGSAGHTTAKIPDKAPTCTETGLTEGEYCSVCKTVLVAQEMIPETGHSYDANNQCTICGMFDMLAGGDCGENLEWTLDKNGVLIISGNGDMADYALSDMPWNAYRNSITQLEIQQGVTSISDMALCGCENLITVTLPEGVTKIGDSAFADCRKLKRVELPDSLVTIDSWAFSGCGRLTDIEIPGNVNSIGDCVFAGCYSLTDIVIPDGVTRIGDSLFNGCISLKRIVVPNTVTSFGYGAFSDCESLTEIVIPDGITIIEEGTFNRCLSLTSLVLPEGLVSIGYGAFAGCMGLTEIAIPASVQTIDEEAFAVCNSLTDVYYGGTLQQWLALGSYVPVAECIHYNCTDSSNHWQAKHVEATCMNDGYNSEACACGYERNKVTTETALGHDMGEWYTVNEPTCTATGLQRKDCSRCEHFEEETISASHKYVEGICSDCKKIEVQQSGICGENLTWELDTFGTLTISGSGVMMDYAWEETPWGDNRENIKAVVIEPGITTIGDYAFSKCINLTDIKIPDSVTSIGEDAFNGCSRLSSVTLGKGVTNVGNCAFWCCTNLTSVEIQEGITSIGNSAFAYCEKLTTIEIPASVTHIGGGAFADCTKLMTVNIPEGVTSIESGTFSNCSSLTVINIPEGVTNIGQSAFQGCSCLANIVVPDSVTSIGAFVFSGCSNLHSLTIPFVGDCVKSETDTWQRPLGYLFGTLSYEGGVLTTQYYYGNGTSSDAITYGHYYIPATLQSVTVTCGNILRGAFYNCTNLTDIRITSDTTSIGSEAFYNCIRLTTVELPESVTTIGNKAFQNCKILGRIELSSSTTNICEYAFLSCNGLAEITIPAGVTTIGEDAFSACNNIEDVYYGGTAEQWTALGKYVPDTEYMHYSAVPAEDHWKNEAVDATCIEAAHTHDVCACGHERNKVSIGLALGHSEVTDVAVAPTCTENGLTEGKHCSACGETLVAQEIVPKNGHSHETVVTPPTCTADGYTTHTCSACGDHYTDSPVEKLGHDMGDWYTVNEPTCTATGLQRKDCSRCEHFETEEIPKVKHNYEAAVTPPTCTADGYTTHTCSACGDHYTDSPVGMLGHNMGDWYTVNEPTCTATGLQRRDCSRCEYHEEKSIEASGHCFEKRDAHIICAVCEEELAIRFTQEYVSMIAGQTLALDISPAEFKDKVTWVIEDNKAFIKCESNVVTAESAGTAFVMATIAEDGFDYTVRFRVDVVEKIEINDIQLSTNKVTTELYKDDFATFEILLDLPQNRPENAAIISNSAANAGAKKNNIIDSVRFEKNFDLFELEMLDDRTVQIVPTQKALDTGKTVKSSYTDTVIVTIQGKEYPITEKLTLTVKKTLPKLKATIGAFNSFYEGQAQEIVITGGDVTGIRANGDKATAIPAWLTLENGSLKLNGVTPKSSDKAYLWIDVDGWRVPAELTLNVKHSYKAPTLKLPATSVSLNSLNGDKKEIIVTSSFADYVPSDLEITHNAGDALTIEKEGNRFTVSTNEKTAHNKTYKITIATSNPKIKAVTLTVKTVGKAPTMNSLKLKGTLDVTFPANKLTIGVTMKDYADAFEPTLIIKDSKGNDVTEQFTAHWNGAEFEVAPNGIAKGTYNVSVTALGLEKTAKLTVKETLPKIKLSATKVTLNKNLNSSVEIDITSATKGYELKSSAHVEAPAQVKAISENGKLTVSLNESAEYGKTYKVTVSAYKGAPAVSLSIAVPKKDKSDVSATIKAAGSIDVIRGESAITITPTFTNAYASDMESMELRFYKRNGKVWENVTQRKYFHAEEVDGKFIVTADENLTSSDKYQAELVYKVGGKELKSKQIAMTLKMGSAKVTIKSSDTTMFAKDRNDRALVWFEATDLTLNDVAKIEIKDAKYKDAFTIIDYEDGTFGLAFKEGKIHKEIEKLIAKKTSATITLNLNVFIEGNTTTKANATAKITLTIVK